jgi:4-hydroxy-tetrahydrodipicolinate synthase
MFEGVHTAIVTPFADGKVDYDALGELVKWQIESGVNGIVPCGTTGESATLDETEHGEVIEFVVKQAGGRVKVIAGTGSNATRTAVTLTAYAEKVGADGALVISPYYNKPTPEGMYQHYLEISKSTSLPLVLYNVPSRTGRNLPVEVVERLAGRENVVAVKEASGDLGQVSRIAANTSLTVISGDDSLTLPILSVGGKGVISVASNVVPVEMRSLVEAYLAGDTDKALAIHQKLFALFKMLFIETNPIPVKTVLAAMGKIREEFRLPLVSMEEGNRARLMEVVSQLGIL